MRILASAILLFLATLVVVVVTGPTKADYSRYAVIHMPASGECPKGFRPLATFKRAGKVYYGCSAPLTAQNGGMLDRLDPGESINFTYLTEGGPK